MADARAYPKVGTVVDHLPVRPGLLGDFVGGVWGPAEAGGTRADMSPADTSDVLGHFADSTAADAVRAVDAAAAALPAWRASGAIKRAEIVRRAERAAMAEQMRSLL